jgi:predicted TIM-barrel fold metal-dependent hydrolase
MARATDPHQQEDRTGSERSREGVLASSSIIDLDRHVIEPFAMWRDYMPRAFALELPELRRAVIDEAVESRCERLGEALALLPPPDQLWVGDRLAMNIPESGALVCAQAAAERQAELLLAATGEGHLAHMDQHGIRVSLLMPTLASYFAYNELQRPELCRAFAAAYNRWVLDICASDPTRLKAAALISRHDPAACAADLAVALSQGFRAVVLRPNPVFGKTLACSELAQFWAACAANDVTVFLHEGSHANVVAAGSDRFATRFGQIVSSHPLEMMLALLTLVEGGVFEHHPRLRVCVLEAGCGWVPTWLWRMNEQYEYHRAELVRQVRRPPSEYVKEQCWFAVEPEEPSLPGALDCLGAGHLVYGSDYPHHDHTAEIAQSVLALGRAAGASALKQILWESPATLLGLNA